MMGKEVNKR